MNRVVRVLSKATAKPYRSSDVTGREPPYLSDDGHVGFAPDDVEDPRNWSLARRCYVSVAALMLLTNATFASSSPSGCFEVRTPFFHCAKTRRGAYLPT